MTTTAERFWVKVERGESSECWPWLAGKDDRGYGYFTFSEGSPRPAYRVAYELVVGAIPEGLELDHLCRNTACVNPAHLEAVTHRENVLRGNSPAANHARKTHCKRGHEFTPENTKLYRGARWCRKCAVIRTRLHRERYPDSRKKGRVVRIDYRMDE